MLHRYFYVKQRTFISKNYFYILVKNVNTIWNKLIKQLVFYKDLRKFEL